MNGIEVLHDVPDFLQVIDGKVRQCDLLNISNISASPNLVEGNDPFRCKLLSGDMSFFP